jgi:adenosylcobinamide-phosphate synthase
MDTILIFAAILDYFIGDPWNWWHPVQTIGWCIEGFKKFILKNYQKPWQRSFGGVFLCLAVVFGSGFVSGSIVQLGSLFHSWLGQILAIVLVASCFAGRSLRDAATDVLNSLNARDLDKARSTLSLYVGRDTQNMAEKDILRAVLETVAENSVDGVTAPLFYAILGAFIPDIGCVPLIFAYKASSTIDSTIGYLHEPYKDIGWFGAKLEDGLTWLPCRLTVLTLALISGKPRQMISLCRRDATKDPSPNSGWSECIYAAILGVQLGGTNHYRGEIKEKPLLGNAIEDITTDKILSALKLTRYCFLLWLSFAITAIQLTHNQLNG